MSVAPFLSFSSVIVGGGESFSSAAIPNGMSSIPVSNEVGIGSNNEGTMSSNFCVSLMYDCIHSLSL